MRGRHADEAQSVVSVATIVKQIATRNGRAGQEIIARVMEAGEPGTERGNGQQIRRMTA